MAIRKTKEDRARDAIRESMTEPVYRLIDNRRANIIMAIKHLGYNKDQASNFVDEIIVEINKESDEFQKLAHQHNL